jgi:CubicO group peptidase (beta-lactamase class C family)
MHSSTQIPAHRAGQMSTSGVHVNRPLRRRLLPWRGCRPLLLMRLAVLLVLVSTAGSACVAQGETGADRAPPMATSATTPPVASVRFPDPEWATADPATHGVDPARLEDVAGYLASIDSNCMAVIKDGYLVDSRYWNGTTPDNAQVVYSATKSVTGTLVGIAQDEGLLNIDQPASTYLHEWRGTPSEGVTIRNLLRGDSGRHWDPDTDLGKLLVAPDQTAFSMALDQQHPPGDTWHYSNAAVQTLEPILKRATGRPVEDYAQAKLFGPIGMRATYTKDPAGNDYVYSNLQAGCLDMAKFGYLALNRGNWNGRQVVSQGWFDEATTKASQQLDTEYGLLWWRNTNGRHILINDDVVDDGAYVWPAAPPDTFWAFGLGSQLVIVVPSEHLIVVRLGGNGSPPGAQVDVVGPEIMKRLGAVGR